MLNDRALNNAILIGLLIGVVGGVVVAIFT